MPRRNLRGWRFTWRFAQPRSQPALLRCSRYPRWSRLSDRINPRKFEPTSIPIFVRAFLVGSTCELTCRWAYKTSFPKSIATERSFLRRRIFALGRRILAHPQTSQIYERIELAWIGRQGALEILRGCILLVESQQCGASIVKRLRISRIQCQRAAERHQSLRGLVQGQIEPALFRRNLGIVRR